MFINISNLLISPLEQFQVIPLIPLKVGVLDLSITNVTIILIILIFIVFSISESLKSTDSTLRMIPNAWQSGLESIFSMILSLVTSNIQDKKAQKFFPMIFNIFLAILLINMTGLVPYSFTLTSHIMVTFVLSFGLFVGINIICVRKHGIKMFSLFLPPQTSIGLAFLLVPIELISYIFKPISLSIRLFANMMAGHTLLKVIAGFACSLATAGGFMVIIHFIPLFILVPLFCLELGVVLIQSFVFSVLISIYLNDALNLH